MSVLLIQMSNVSFYIISLFHLRCYKTRGVGLINTVIIVTYFPWGLHSAFGIFIVTRECAVSRLRTIRSIVCQRY